MTGKIEPISLVSFVKKQCTSGGNLTALAVKRDGLWKKWSYDQYLDEIQVSTDILKSQQAF